MSVFGSRIPRELKALPIALTKVDQPTYKNILKYVLTTLEGGVNRKTLEEVLGSSLNDNITAAAAGLFCLLNLLFRADAGSLKPEVLQFELQEARLSQEVTLDLTKIIANQRSQTLYNSKYKSLRHPTLEQFNWRVDVSISTSSLCRVLEPTIICEMTLNNGDIKRFEMPMKMFHNLRFQVATVLKEMHHIEHRDLV